eukprot:360458-Chlamydomonas_euryale.AAC.1
MPFPSLPFGQGACLLSGNAVECIAHPPTVGSQAVAALAAAAATIAAAAVRREGCATGRSLVRRRATASKV